MTTKSVARKDDKRRWLLKWVKKALRSRWLFRGLMLLWKFYYDHIDR